MDDQTAVHILDLDDHLVFRCLNFLPAKALLRLACTCRQYQIFANDKSIWETLYSARWSGDTNRMTQTQMRRIYTYNEGVLQCIASLPVGTSARPLIRNPEN